MADIKTLREQAMNAATSARSLLEEAENTNDAERRAELEAQHDAAMREYDDAVAMADRLEKVESAERSIEAHAENAEREARENARPDTEGVVVPDSQIGYREAFHKFIQCRGVIGDMEPEMRAAIESRAQTTLTDGAGGVLVPTELSASIIKVMALWGPMYDTDVCNVVITQSGAQWDLPVVDDTGRTVGAHVEGQPLVDDGSEDVTFSKVTIAAHEYTTAWLRLSKALMDDSAVAMEGVLTNLLGEGLGRLANKKLTVGAGGGTEPNGVAVAAGIGHTAASVTAFTWDEVLDLEHSVDPAYRASPKARYMFNDAVLAEARKLKDGDGNYLWQMGNVAAGVPSSFNGRQYSVNQSMDGLATGKRPILFGDFGKYYVRKVGSPMIMVANDSKFLPGAGIAGYIRFDGQLVDNNAIKALVMA